MRGLPAFAVVSAAALLLAGCGAEKPAASEGASRAAPAAKSIRFTKPVVDPAAPFPAMSGGTLDALARDISEIAQRREAILAAEGAAIQGVLDARQAKPPAKGKGANPRRPAAILSELLGELIPSAHAVEGIPQQLIDFIIGHNFVLLLGTAGANEVPTRDGQGPVIEMKEGGKVVSTATIAVENGQVVTTLETKVNVPLIFLEANSKVSITGSVCPAADGKVDFTLKLGANGRAGQGGAATYDQHVEVRVVVQVDDDANIADATFDIKQDTRSTHGGRQAHVESGVVAKAPDGYLVELPRGAVKVTRPSPQGTDGERSGDDALARGMNIANGALEAAKDFWQKSGCIRIQATSPGRVVPGATSTIPVAVTHRKDGSSVPAKVTVGLTGGKSVDPAVIAKAPGNAMHLATQERSATMTIELVATSRRGKATESLKLYTGGDAFEVAGGLQDFHGTGTICDISAPFSIDGSGVNVVFEPTSAKGGTYRYTGKAAGVTLFGDGTYTVTYKDETPVGITGTGVGSVKSPMGVFSAPGTEKYRLTPRDPC